MAGLNLENLEKYRDEILKAEIASLMSLWDKVNPNQQNKANINLNKKSLSDWENDIKDKKIKILEEEIDLWDNFLNNWRNKWRSQKNNKYLLQVLYGIGESLNSGIDKGSPKDDIKVEPQDSRWLSNPFGSFKNRIIYLSETEDSMNYKICDLKNSITDIIGSNNLDWEKFKSIREKFKNFFAGLLSDDRFPINDVSLWEQAYMATTMFKASLSEYILKNNNIQSLPKRMDVRWRILGIQYDKLRLAEKGYKPQQIQWYREVSNEIDDEIKKLLEYKYPIGNEVYRDETGVYFLVGEDLGEDLDESSLAELKDDLREIEDEIINIFKEKSFDEFYPAIFLTKASRGLMNLSYLLEKAKENFLKADWSKKEVSIDIEKSESEKAIGICQVCGQRLVFRSDRSDENKNICYEKKTQGRIYEWLKDTKKETIWMDELKDENDRVALVTMKFELHDWLNGDMLNSLLVREEDYIDKLKLAINTLNVIKTLYIENAFLLDKYKDKNGNLNDQFLLKIENIVSPVSDSTLLRKYKGLELKMKNFGLKLVDRKNNEQPLKTLLNNEPFKNFIKIFDFKLFNLLARDAYDGCKNNDESFDDFIRQIFFGSIIGTHWEEWIKKNGLNSKIDWDKEIIKWNHLTYDDIEFLSTLILQFLIRKNPSPARLRRIWESTKEFFEDIKANICAYACIPIERRRRYYWKDVKIEGKDENIQDGEYYDGEAVFWANKGKVYLISYVKDLTRYKEFNLKRYKDKKDMAIKLNLNDSKSEYYEPYISIIDPTPISWQFIIPAEYVPNLIENVIKKYNENFKFVYGKLPLHIGIVVQDYKKPLYVGVKALRKIRRDIENTEELILEEKACKIKNVLKCQKIEESLNNTQNYYSLYWGSHKKGYEFYLKPDNKNKKWILNIDKLEDDEEINIMPNTFDFEFLDTNTRRNDIYYDKNNKWKRKIALKNSRPYDLDTWEKFKKFKELFGKENKSGVTRSTKLQKLISVIYDKWESIANYKSDMNNDVEGIKVFLASSFINILELKKDEELAKGIKKLFDIEVSQGNDKLYEALKEKMTTENLQLFLDMFEFWHTTLKEV